MSRAHPAGLVRGRGRPRDAPRAVLPLQAPALALTDTAEQCPSSRAADGILNTPASVATFQLQSFLKKEKCVSCGVIVPAALPCMCCVQPVLHGSWWQFLLLSLNPSVSLSLGCPCHRGLQGPSPAEGCSLVCSSVGQAGRCSVNGQGKRHLHSSYTHLSKIPVPSVPTWHFFKGSGGVFFSFGRTGHGGR